MGRKPTDKQLYKLKNEHLGGLYPQVSPLDFYRDMFPEGALERPGCPDDRKPNAIYTSTYSVVEGDVVRKFARNTLVFDDLAAIQDVLGNEFAVMSPLTYVGRRRKADNSFHLWGFCIDLDGVELQQLGDLIFQIQNGVLPEPTYLVNSGHGLHVYFLFEDPIPLFNYLHKPLQHLKEELTKIVWNAYTSTLPPEERQFQGIFQGFRMPGTQSKLGKRYPVVAFKTGAKRTLRYLNEFVPEDKRVNFDEFHHTTLQEAQQKWPEWYQKRIVEKQPRGRWTCKRDLYDWWIRQIRAGAFDGNRYNCIATLITYAVKCGIDQDEVLNDALQLVPWLNSLTRDKKNEFTIQDVYDAFTYYDESYVRYSIKAIQARTKITFPRNKRNGQKQADHLEEARAIRDIRMKRQGRTWHYTGGAPTKEQLVKDYAAEHPEASVTEIARATGVSRPTVYKWLKTL